jgi:maleamate amidohydrolase
VNAGRTAKDTRFIQERGFGKRLGLGNRPCFLVVDYIKGFTDPSQPMGAESGREIEAVNRFLSVCRTADIPVIFTIIAYEDNSLADAGIWMSKMQGLRTLKAGTALVELDSRLHYQAGDTLLVKKYASAFFGTDLASRLNAAQVDSVIVAGCTTSGCVRSTVVDALQYGYRPIVLKDAVGDRFDDAHQQSLIDMDLKYADVIPTDEVIGTIMKRMGRKIPNG